LLDISVVVLILMMPDIAVEAVLKAPVNSPIPAKVERDKVAFGPGPAVDGLQR
jgi:hypothetical protein